jgi:hypothetical protein
VQRSQGPAAMRRLSNKATFRVVAILTGLTLVGVAGGIQALAGVHALDICLQGDVTNQNSGQTGAPSTTCATSQKDWTDFFQGGGTYDSPNTSGGTTTISSNGGRPKSTMPAGANGTFVDRVISPDFADGTKTPDPTTFTTGSKDTSGILGSNNPWQCAGSSNVGAKVNLLNTYAAVEVNVNQPDWSTSGHLTGTSSAHTILYYASEIESANGDHNQGMWLLQDPGLGCSTTGGATDFTSSSTSNKGHRDGDLLLAVAMTGGGSKPTSASVVVFRWSGNDSTGTISALGSGENIGSLCGSGSGLTDIACATTNSSWSVQTPWADGATNNILGAQQFFEGAVDLTAVNQLFGVGQPCFNSFLTDTRSSQSDTSTLFDFTNGSLQTCAHPSLATQPYKQLGASQNQPGCTLSTGCDTAVGTGGVDTGSSVYDTSSLSSTFGTPKGTVTYDLYTSCTNDSKGEGVGSGVPSNTSPAVGTTADPNAAGGGSLVSGVAPNSNTYQLTLSATPAASLTLYFVATYSGDTTLGGLNNGATSPCEPVKINPKTVTLATCAGTWNAAGTPPCTGLVTSAIAGTVVGVTDTAILTGALNPSGSATFQLVGPISGNSTTGFTCGSAVTLYSDANGTVQVTNGTFVTSAWGGSSTTSTGTLYFKPTQVGTYYWEAKWGGDANNTAPNGGNYVGCSATTGGDPNEAVTVAKVTPAATSGIILNDTFTVTTQNSLVPTGTVKFYLYDNTACTGSPVASWTNSGNGISLNSAGTATTYGVNPDGATGPFVAVSGKTYSWKEVYSGDSHYTTGTFGCGTTPTETAGIQYS